MVIGPMLMVLQAPILQIFSILPQDSAWPCAIPKTCIVLIFVVVNVTLLTSDADNSYLFDLTCGITLDVY